MANSDKNIVITPNIGSTTADPRVVFSGASSTLGPQNITLQVYPTNNGTLSFEGSAGQLFSITNSLSGTIFSVNDVSGIPSIEVLDTGTVKIAQYGGNVGIGTGDVAFALGGGVVLYNSTSPRIELKSPTTGTTINDGVGIAEYLGDMFVFNKETGKSVVLITESQERIRITGAGRVLIGTGTDNGTDRLQINGTIIGTQLKSSIAIGTAPFVVTSTTRVSNLNVATAGTADNILYNQNNNIDLNSIATGNRFATFNAYYPSGGAYNQPIAGGNHFKIMEFGNYNPSDTNTWKGQIAMNFYTDQMWFRRQATLTWQAWREFIHSGNYNSFSPTLTGTGASGTWGINITGNSATVTNGVYTTGDQSIGGVKTFSGTLNWGNGGTRVYTKDDAGAIASKSGFFESASPTNYYTGASSWQHLIESRHSNDSNNYAMQIAGSFFDQSIWFRKTNNSATTAWTQFLTTSFCAVTGSITATGDITAYFSDARLKTFEGTIPNALNKILSLNGYYFYENELAKSLGYNNDKRQVGVSAQEVQKIMPEVVTTAPISDEYLTVKYEKLVPLLIEAIKEQQAIIENQNQRLSNLERLVNNTGSRN